MRDSIDLDAYFARIGYHGARTATLETLHAIHALHPLAIPFENLNPLLRLPVQLDPASLQNKLIGAGRGGYCYEHNLLFKLVLEALGFRVSGLAARVLLNQPEDAITARIHMLLRVDIGAQVWLADVGFGGLTSTAPLRLIEHVEQATPHEPFRITTLAGDYALQAQLRGAWRTLYRFDLQVQQLTDYELASWYLCHHPQSRFLINLVAARAQPQRRYALLNNELAIHELHGETVRRTLASAAQLRAVLTDTFGITLPEHPAASDLLDRVAAGTPPAP